MGTKILCHECALECLSCFAYLLQSDVSQGHAMDIFFGTSDLIKTVKKC